MQPISYVRTVIATRVAGQRGYRKTIGAALPANYCFAKQIVICTLPFVFARLSGDITCPSMPVMLNEMEIRTNLGVADLDVCVQSFRAYSAAFFMSEVAALGCTMVRDNFLYV